MDDRRRFARSLVRRDPDVGVAGRRFRPSRSLALLAAALGFLLLAPSPGLGQDETEEEAEAATSDSARVVGQVISELTGEPISAAGVTLRGSRVGAFTESDGQFALPTAAAGIDTLEVRYVGYEPGFVELDLRAGHTTRLVLLLSPDAVSLAELEVTVNRGPGPGAAMTEGFRHRMARGIGTFFTREDIERRNPRHTSDLLRTVPGVRIGAQRVGRTSVVMSRGALGGCSPEIFVDGLHLQGASVDDVIVPDLGGVEVYSGPTRIPPRFSTLAPTNCGAVVIWTRRGDPNRPDRR